MSNDTTVPLTTTLAVQALVSMAVVTVPVLAPAAALEAGVPASFAGIFIALVYGAGMSASLVSGPLIQRFGAIRLSQACLVSCAAGLACVATGALPLFAAGALLLGAGYGPVTPASSHILAKTTPPERMALIFSIKQTGVPIGGALAGAMVPTLVLWSGWRVTALIVAGACAVTALLAQALRNTFDADRILGKRLRAANLAGSLRYTLSDSDLRRLALSSFCFAALQLCLVTFLVTYLTLNSGVSLVTAGLMLTIAQVGGAVARVGWGALADRWGQPTRVLGFTALAMGAAAVAAGAFTSHWPIALIALVCVAFGATAIGWNGVYLAQVARLAPPGKAGDATGGALVFTYAGVLFGPPVFTLLVGWGASYAVTYVLVALPAVVCGLWLLWRRDGQRAMDTHEVTESPEGEGNG